MGKLKALGFWDDHPKVHWEWFNDCNVIILTWILEQEMAFNIHSIGMGQG